MKIPVMNYTLMQQPLMTEPKIQYTVLYLTTKKAHMDLILMFSYFLIQVNGYVLIANHYNYNAIVGVPLTHLQAVNITKTWQYLRGKLYSSGVTPKTWILDNETSNILQTAMKKYQTNYQLVLPHIYRANSVEIDIQNF